MKCGLVTSEVHYKENERYRTRIGSLGELFEFLDQDQLLSTSSSLFMKKKALVWIYGGPQVHDEG